MTHVTLCYLMRENPPDEILLGLKKVGFGEGKYGGFGGKIEAGETVTAAAVRELQEVVHVFLVTRWDGNPVESAEMIPAWFASDDIPLEHMWQDVYHWLPRILAGERIRASFTFKEDNETVDEVKIEPWNGGEE